MTNRDDIRFLPGTVEITKEQLTGEEPIEYKPSILKTFDELREEGIDVDAINAEIIRLIKEDK